MLVFVRSPSVACGVSCASAAIVDSVGPCLGLGWVWFKHHHHNHHLLLLYLGFSLHLSASQSGDMYGQEQGSIKPEHMTNEVWDYIFLRG
jgi:hypothetical protein